MKTPFIGFSNKTLSAQDTARKGDLITCPQCGQKHPLECGTSNGKESDLIMFYKCGTGLYMGALAGRLTIGVKSDVQGEM
jgi:hypothetical protein